MKNILLLLITLLFSKFCYAQQISFADSLSRAKADFVLSQFDSLHIPKLLFSLEDRYYYVLFYEGISPKEFFISIDSVGSVRTIEQFNIKVDTKKQRKQLATDKMKLNKLAPFDLSKYHENYVTTLPLDYSCCTFGRLTYFVIKDIEGRRFGEFHILMPTIPSPIDFNLWIYLIEKIAANIRYNSD